MMSLLYIFIGGGMGALSRYGVSCLFPIEAGSNKLPYSTLLCNVLGCLLIGILFAWQKNYNPSWLQPLLITGLLGGFTTFSAFGLDTQKLIQNGATGTAILYVSISVTLGLATVFLGIKLIK